MFILSVSCGHRFDRLLEILLIISMERRSCSLTGLMDFIHHHVDCTSGKSYLTPVGN